MERFSNSGVKGHFSCSGSPLPLLTLIRSKQNTFIGEFPQRFMPDYSEEEFAVCLNNRLLSSRCQGCANEVRRHSKSLDTSRFICSICKGRFELFVNSKRNNQVTPAKERKPSPFSIFVKDEYRGIKASTPHLKHSEIMSALSERWKAVKNSV